jgi:hypothetical protein
MPDEAPTIEERYIRSTNSSNLVVRPHWQPLGDVDPLIAAGWIKDGMGPMLYRLACEFDAVAAEARKAAADDKTAMLLILMRLKTLPPARDALGRWAVIEATKGRFLAITDATVLQLVGRILQSFLDPNCRACEGRGANGGYGAPQLVCRACRGSGKSRSALGSNAHEREFCAHMLAEMDRMLDEVDRLMRQFLRQRR